MCHDHRDLEPAKESLVGPVSRAPSEDFLPNSFAAGSRGAIHLNNIQCAATSGFGNNFVTLLDYPAETRTFICSSKGFSALIIISTCIQVYTYSSRVNLLIEINKYELKFALTALREVTPPLHALSRFMHLV